MTRIFLIGYMGAGKTTVGKALSKELGIPFYDLDWYIESRNMLHEVGEFENVIISCGGGTPCFFDNIDYMNQQGQVVYLKATPEVLYKHLLMAKVERPLLKGKSSDELIAYIREHLLEREPSYSKARYTLDVSLMDNFEKIKTTIENIRELLKL